MKKSHAHGVILAAAAAGILSFGWVERASAQYPVQGQDGHANDANNRVGSGGINGPHQGEGGSTVTPDNIVNRQVTGLSGFAGPIHERDPRAFTGPIPQGVDAIVRQSAGPGGISGAPLSNRAQPYYGASRFVAPPSGSVPLGTTGGYIGTTAANSSSLSNGLNTESPLMTGLQAKSESRDTLLLNAMLNPGAYGNINSTTNSEAAMQAALFYGQHTTLAPGENNVISPDFSSQSGIENPDIMRMRAELLQAVEPFNPNAPVNPNGQTPAGAPKNSQPGQPGQAPTGLNQPLNQPLGQPFDAPVNSPLTSGLTNSQIANDPMSSTGIIPANVRQTPSLIPANLQSPLLNTLQQRLAQSSDVGKAMADAQANTPPRPAQGPQTPRIAQPATPGTPEEGPVKVQDLATGIKAKGLHDLLAGGEQLTTDAKYDSAIEKFNEALRVAPNNPLPLLGRANAELAGGYYARAEQDLRLVFRANRELLMAQFDLKALFPKDRADDIRKDLNDLAAADPKAVRPWFLLAYLDYNTNKPASADQDLNEAQKRAGSSDASIRLLKQHWTLPSNHRAVPPAPKSPTPRSP